MGRFLVMAIAIAIYFAFFGAFLYLVGFVGGFGSRTTAGF